MPESESQEQGEADLKKGLACRTWLHFLSRGYYRLGLGGGRQIPNRGFSYTFLERNDVKMAAAVAAAPTRRMRLFRERSNSSRRCQAGNCVGYWPLSVFSRSCG